MSKNGVLWNLNYVKLYFNFIKKCSASKMFLRFLDKKSSDRQFHRKSVDFLDIREYNGDKN